jgi:hypothetical protein
MTFKVLTLAQITVLFSLSPPTDIVALTLAQITVLFSLSPPNDVVDVDVGAVPPADSDAIVLEQLTHQFLLVQSFKTLHPLNLFLKTI